MRRALVTSLLAGGLVCGALAPASAGPTWAPPAPISPSDENAENPQVATRHDEAVVVWQRNTAAGEQIVAAALSPGGTWEAEQPLSAVGPQTYGQQVEMDAYGSAVAVWEASGRIQVARRPAGGAWHDARTLSGRHAHFPDVATNLRGAITVVWQKQIDGHDRTQAVRRPVGGAWTKPRTISKSFGDVIRPTVAMDQHGNASVVWERMWADGGRSAVFVARRPAHGSWSDQLRLSPGTSASGPFVARDAHGRTLVAWNGQHHGQPRIKVTLRNAGGGWLPIEALGYPGAGASLAELAMDNPGNAMITGVSSIGGDTRAVVWQRPAGGNWHAPTVVSPAGADVRNVQLAKSTIIVWETDVEVQAVRRSGGGSWGSVESLSGGNEGFDADVAMSYKRFLVAWKWFDASKDRVVATSAWLS
jgi:hypothetical protein